jgi:hypothetical protein
VTQPELAGRDTSSEDTHRLLARMVDFLVRIGLPVRMQALEAASFLPGVAIEHGVLIVDEAALTYPGDLLHEAGHLAVAPPADRAAMHKAVGADPAEEMMALSWSYAAARHLDIDPAVVFHPHGYKGGSQGLLGEYEQGRYLALPMLQWCGMAYDKSRAEAEGAEPFPVMQRWLRA